MCIFLHVCMCIVCLLVLCVRVSVFYDYNIFSSKVAGYPSWVSWQHDYSVCSLVCCSSEKLSSRIWYYLTWSCWPVTNICFTGTKACLWVCECIPIKVYFFWSISCSCYFLSSVDMKLQGFPLGVQTKVYHSMLNNWASLATQLCKMY